MITKPKPGFRINPLHPLSRGLVAWWLFNEGGGPTAFDQSGNSKHGTLTNMDLPIAWNSQGLKFDGTNDYVGLGTPIVSTYPFSVAVRFNISALTGVSQCLFSVTSATGEDRHSINLGNTLTYNIASQDLPTNELATGGTTLSLSAWYFICGVWASATDRRVYLNGLLDGSNTGNVTPTGMTDTLFGLRLVSGTESPFNGHIDQLRVYNRELLQVEIRQLFTNPYANVITSLENLTRVNGFLSTTMSGLGNIFRRRRRSHKL